MRKMAYIVKIDEVTTHPNADALDLCYINGWQVVAKRDDFRTGDLAVYCEIDSFLPTEIAPFLTKPGHFPKEYNGVSGEKLKTIRLRQELSQGLLLPCSVLPDGLEITPELDVSDILGIQKWEAPVDVKLRGDAAGSFPSLIPKTDETRCQNLSQRVLEEYSHYTWEVTEKLEGTSATYFLDEHGEFYICSRNMRLKPSTDHTYGFIAEFARIEKFMRDKELINYAIQGEIIGPGIQGNIYKLQKPKFMVYNVYDAKERCYLPAYNRDTLMPYINNEFCGHVPVLETSFKFGGDSICKTLLEYAEGKSTLYNTEREGVVFKCIENPNLSFKAISNKYLLKEK